MGGSIILIGLIFLFQAVVFGVAALLQLWGVSEQVAEWLAPLLVGLVAVLIDWAFLAKGRSNLRPSNLAPNRTIETLRRHTQLEKEQMR